MGQDRKLTPGSFVLVAVGCFAAGVTVAAAIAIILREAPERIVIDRSKHFLVRERAPGSEQVDERRRVVPMRAPRLHIDTDPVSPGTVVDWDGQRLGTAPLQAEVEVNEDGQALELTASDGRRSGHTLRAEPGASVPATLEVPVQDGHGLAERAIRRVEKTYARAGAVHVGYDGRHRVPGRRTIHQDDSELWVDARGRMRIEQGDTLLIYDHRRVYGHTSDDDSVVVYDDLSDLPLDATFWFLTGNRRLPRTLRPVLGRCPPHWCGEWDVLVEFWPTAELPDVDHLELVVNMPAGLVTVVARVDAQGNRSEYLFRIQTFGAVIDRDLFRFDPPPGTTVVSAAR